MSDETNQADKSADKSKEDGSQSASTTGANDMRDLKRSMLVVGDAVLGAAVLVLLGVWGGGFLDQKLNTGPWCSIGLSMLGAGLGLARMVMKAMELDKKAPAPNEAHFSASPSTSTESAGTDSLYEDKDS